MPLCDGVQRINILGSCVDTYTVPLLHERIADTIDNGHKALVLNVNVHGINLAMKHPWMQELFHRAPVVFCDGSGVVLGRV